MKLSRFQTFFILFLLIFAVNVVVFRITQRKEEVPPNLTTPEDGANNLPAIKPPPPVEQKVEEHKKQIEQDVKENKDLTKIEPDSKDQVKPISNADASPLPSPSSSSVEYYLFTTVPNTIKVHQQNAIRSWLVLDPPPKHIFIFCNSEEVKNQIFAQAALLPKKDLVTVLPVPSETIADSNGKKYPKLDGLFLGALQAVKQKFNKAASHVHNDYFLAYLNSDIILTQSFAKTMTLLEKIRVTEAKNNKDVYALARRFNIELGDMEIMYKLDPEGVKEVDAWINDQRRQKGQLFPSYAEDAFVYTPRTFMYTYSGAEIEKTEKPVPNDDKIAIPPFVSVSVAWDNWLTAYGVKRKHRLLGIDISTSAILLHHNHGEIKASHQNTWASENRKLFAETGMTQHDGYITQLPLVITKHGELKERPWGQEPKAEDFD